MIYHVQLPVGLPNRIVRVELVWSRLGKGKNCSSTRVWKWNH